MKLKNIKCKKCDCDELLAIQKRMSVVGLYCKKCGAWIKWANKDEKTLCFTAYIDSLYNWSGCPDIEEGCDGWRNKN